MYKITHYLFPFALFLCSFATVDVLASESLHIDKPAWNWHDRHFINFSIKQKLARGKVTKVIEDNHGFIWAVTSEGLARFDGVNFEAIQTEFNQQYIDINTITKDMKGDFWLGSDQGLFQFNPNTRSFTPYPLHPKINVSISALQIEESKTNKVIWIGTTQGLKQLDTDTLVVTSYLKQQFIDNPGLRIFALLKANDSSIWVATSIGLFVKTTEQTTFSLVDLSAQLPQSQRISALIQTSDNKIWAATPRDGVLIIDSKKQVDTLHIEGFKREWIYSMAEIKTGTVWLGTFGSGIIEINLQGKYTTRLKHNRLLPNSLANNEIWHVFAASNRLVWIGSSQALSVFNSENEAIKTLFGNIGRNNGINDIGINSVTEDPNGNLWLGLRTNGIDIVNTKYGVTKRINVEPNTPELFIPSGSIYDIVFTENNTALIASNWGIYRSQNYHTKQLNLLERDSNEYTSSLHVEGNNLWAGGTDGLWHFYIKNDELVDSKHIAKPAGQLTNHKITTLGKAPNNDLIVATWNGINWLNNKGKVTYRIPQENSRKNLFDEGFISSFFYDNKQRLWIGTEGAGIYIGEAGIYPTSFTQLTKKQGLSSNIIRAMQADHQGNIWVSSASGIDVINSQSLSINSLSAANEALVAPYFRSASVKTSANDIVFAGSGGMTVITPSQWKTHQDFAPLHFVKSQIGNTIITDPTLGNTPDAPLAIPAEHNQLNVEFSALDYFYGNSILYRYRLLGLSDSWNYVDADHRTAAYTMLPPGSFVLEVQNSNQLGQWNSESRILHLQVLPFWYQTWWATLFFLLSAISIILLFIRLRFARINKRQQQLEQLVEERTHSLQQLMTKLQQKTEQLEHISVTDPLTNLNNRRYLNQHIEKDIALTNRRYRNFNLPNVNLEQADLVFILIDIDLFKRVNDQYGHQMGDRVIVEISRRIKGLTRETDYAIRWGGEEFLLVVRDTSRFLAHELAEQICQTIKAEPFRINEHLTLNLTCSVGFAPYPFNRQNIPAISWKDCIDIADKALYTTKYSGRDGWVGIMCNDENIDAKHQQLSVANIPLALLNLKTNKHFEQVKSVWVSHHSQQE